MSVCDPALLQSMSLRLPIISRGFAARAPIAAEGKPGTPPSVVRPGDNVKSTPKALKEPYSEHAVRELTAAGATVAMAPPAPSDGIPVAPPRADAKSEGARPPSDNGDDDR